MVHTCSVLFVLLAVLVLLGLNLFKATAVVSGRSPYY